MGPDTIRFPPLCRGLNFRLIAAPERRCASAILDKTIVLRKMPYPAKSQLVSGPP